MPQPGAVAPGIEWAAVVSDRNTDSRSYWLDDRGPDAGTREQAVHSNTNVTK